MRRRPLRFGGTALVELSDDEALGLCPGAVVIVRGPNGLAELTIDRVRPGVAFTDDNPPEAYAVPVVEAHVGARALVIAVPDCFRACTDEEADALDAVQIEAA